MVHLTNSLKTSTNGTSMHFHGIRQQNNNGNDGVVSITQCATPPGSTVTYKWRATQYGSSWYHSHFALQAWQGLFGAMIIRGPATANYDNDLGMITLGDWDHQTVDALWHDAQVTGPPKLATGLINGTNVWGKDGDAEQTGHRFNLSLTEGQSYRLGMVNTAVDTHFKFSIDNHTLTVIAMDFVPVEPFKTDVISIGMGQRYDVIITADQGKVADSFWMRAVPQTACSGNLNADNIKGIVYYGASKKIPTTASHEYVDSCEDMDAKLLVPHHAETVGTLDPMNKQLAAAGKNSDGFFRWYLNSTTMIVDWGNPTVKQITDKVNAFEQSNAVISLDKANEWAYTVIQTTLAVPHPIHLHGHDFFVLAQGVGDFDSSVALNHANPPRRDTALLPASGYLAIAFKTDNPGAWLMHCHIGWHTSEGFAMQWVVRQDDITDLIDYTSLESTCDAWDTHAATYSVVEDDSGV